MKDLLVHVDDTPSGAARVVSAIDLARDYDACLTGLHVTPDAHVPTGASLDRLDWMLGVSERANAAAARRARKLFEEIVETAGIEHHWISARGDVAEGIVAAARYADLVIMGQYERQGDPIHHPLPVCHRVALEAGRPILVLPESSDEFANFKRVLIAWDGSREDVRAVHDAMPFLKGADEVNVIVVAPEAERLSSDVSNRERLTEHLSHEGIALGEWRVVRNGVSVSKCVQRTIGSGDTDLLVMGAYSHPDWYEFILGGTTQSVLLGSAIPMLISH